MNANAASCSDTGPNILLLQDPPGPGDILVDRVRAYELLAALEERADPNDPGSEAWDLLLLARRAFGLG